MFRNFGLLAIGVIAGSLVFGCNQTTQAPKVKTLLPMEAVGLVRNDFAVLIDVRERAETKEGIALEAVWIPASAIETNAVEWTRWLEKASKQKQAILYSSSNEKSRQVAEKISALGFQTGTLGTYNDWVKAGLPSKPRE